MFQTGAFSFDATKETPESLARRRKAIQNLLDGMSRPQYAGEGLAKGAASIVSALGKRGINDAEAEGRKSGQEAYDSVMANVGGWSPFSGGSGMAGGAGSDDLSGGGLPASIVRTESGGNWSALNSEGYGGRGQFGEARLADAARAGVIPAGMTGADFAKAPQSVQLAVENWHKNDIMGDLGGYVGRDIDGPGGIPPLTPNSILGIAHLGGTGGARRFIESGGRYNPSDSNGTSLADYAKTHAGTGLPGGQGGDMLQGGADSPMVQGQQGGSGFQPAPMPQYNGPSMQDLMGLMQNPWLTPQQRANVGIMMQQAQQANDPMRQMQWQQQQYQLEAARQKLQSPQGYSVLSADEATRLGLPEGAYQRGADGKIYAIGGGGTNVTVNNQGSAVEPLGTQGQILVPDPSQPSGFRVEIAPGSELDRENQKVDDANERRIGLAQSASTVVTAAADRARNAARERDFGSVGTSVVGRVAPWTDSAEVMRQVDVLKAQAVAGNLQAMRDASPTGGALGQVTAPELTLLANKSGALDPNSPTFLRDLEDYERTLLETIHGPEMGRQIFESSRQTTPGTATTFEEFQNDPTARAAAEKYGVTLEEMWELKQGQQ